ncbi:MAG: hypothetical protein KAH22_08085 [Thiotrichaceae bacterium]|nr:hypothetical protein [Thiotrichaceae bacterium]
MSEERIESLVETICEQGCAHVNQVIVLLQKKDSPKGLELLTNTEKNSILQELSSIMAVYDGSDCSLQSGSDQKRMISLPIYTQYLGAKLEII